MSTLARLKRPLLPAGAIAAAPMQQSRTRFGKVPAIRCNGAESPSVRLVEHPGIASGSRFSFFEKVSVPALVAVLIFFLRCPGVSHE
jgi:hypothetical protein